MPNDKQSAAVVRHPEILIIQDFVRKTVAARRQRLQWENARDLVSLGYARGAIHQMRVGASRLLEADRPAHQHLEVDPAPIVLHWVAFLP